VRGIHERLSVPLLSQEALGLAESTAGLTNVSFSGLISYALILSWRFFEANHLGGTGRAPKSL
jgi:hypothetical protein